MVSSSIPDEIIDEIRERVDLVEVASEYLTLKKSGENFKALCPFHVEKTPSFTISQKKQIFHCFGCGVGGNVYSFIMKMENLNFPETVRRLAERSGVTLPTSSDLDKSKDELYRINELARDFYHQSLKTTEGREALEYLQRRGLKRETISSFGLGYAPKGWANFRDAAISKGFRIEQIERAGLILLKKAYSASAPRPEDYYDRFRERLIFPIYSPTGMVVGFGGRILGEGRPKYINSPETPIYNKSRVLYGMNLAKGAIREAEEAIVVEGYTDVILCHQYGLGNAVGSCGTSLTQGHARILRHYAREVVLVYDPDPAGIEATLRGLDILSEEGLGVKVVDLPDGLDPADFLIKRGLIELKKFLESAKGLFDYRLSKALEGIDVSSARGKSKVVEKVIPTIIKTRDRIQQDASIKRLAEVLHLSEEIILEEVRSISKGRRSVVPQQLKEYIKSEEEVIIECERSLVGLILLDEEVMREVWETLDEETFQDALSRRVVLLLKDSILKQESPQIGKILDLLDEQERDVISSLILKEGIGAGRVGLARAYISRMRLNRLNQGIRDLKEKIGRAERTNDKDLMSLLNQYQNLVREVKFLKQGA